jgi:hypothetical protein
LGVGERQLSEVHMFFVWTVVVRNGPSPTLGFELRLKTSLGDCMMAAFLRCTVGQGAMSIAPHAAVGVRVWLMLVGYVCMQAAKALPSQEKMDMFASVVAARVAKRMHDLGEGGDAAPPNLLLNNYAAESFEAVKNDERRDGE